MSQYISNFFTKCGVGHFLIYSRKYMLLLRTRNCVISQLPLKFHSFSLSIMLTQSLEPPGALLTNFTWADKLMERSPKRKSDEDSLEHSRSLSHTHTPNGHLTVKSSLHLKSRNLRSAILPCPTPPLLLLSPHPAASSLLQASGSAPFPSSVRSTLGVCARSSQRW